MMNVSGFKTGGSILYWKSFCTSGFNYFSKYTSKTIKIQTVVGITPVLEEFQLSERFMYKIVVFL